mgnify:CR=1 FL=1
MMSISYFLALLLATQAAIANDGDANIELIGHFTSLPATHGSCGVLYSGTTTKFLDESSNKEILVVVPCLEMQKTKGASGTETLLKADRRYRIKVSTTEPKGLCCFVRAADLRFLTDIQEDQ